MTIDEMISKIKIECKEQKDSVAYLETQEEYAYYIEPHRQAITACEQLAEWLEELKALNQTTQMVDKSNFSQDQYKADTDTAYQCGYTKAIQEFSETLIPRLTDAIYPKDVEGMRNLINEVAEQLREGGVE